MVAGVFNVARVAFHDRAHLDIETAQDTSVLCVISAEDSKGKYVFSVKDIRDVVGKTTERLFFVPADFSSEAQWIKRNKLVGVVVDDRGKLIIGIFKVVHMLLGIERPIHCGFGRVDLQIGN